MKNKAKTCNWKFSPCKDFGFKQMDKQNKEIALSRVPIIYLSILLGIIIILAVVYLVFL